MKILYLAKIDLEQEDAQRVHVMAVCSALARLGHQVLLLAPRPLRPARPCPVPVQQVPLPRARLVGRLLYPLAAAALLAKSIVSWRPDAVYERDVGYDPGPALICRLLRVPYLVEVNGFRPELVGLSRGSRVGLWLFMAI